MKRVPKSFIDCKASKDPDYRRRADSLGVIDGNFYLFSDENYARVAMVPRDDWPAWVLAIEKMRNQSDKGVGDTVARLIAALGGEQFKVWFRKTFAKDCGCSDRQASMNRRFPYPSGE